MPATNGIDIVSAAAFVAALTLVAAMRFHAHDKLKYTATVMVLLGAMALTFSAAFWWPGLYKFVSNGIGLFILGAALAWFGTDFVLQVLKKHTKFDKVKTSWIAAGFGIAGVLFLVNLTGIYHNTRADFTSHNVEQVVDHVNTTNAG